MTQTAVVEPAEEKVEEEPSDDVTVAKETGGAGDDQKKLIKGLGMMAVNGLICYLC